MRTRTVKAVECLSFALLVCAWAQPAPAAEALVVRSSSLKAYDSALAGLRDSWTDPLEVVTLPAAGEDPKPLAARIRASAPRVILALGPQAAAFAAEELAELPRVLCMAGPWNARRDRRTATVANDPLPASQLAAYRLVLPGLKRLATVYHPGTTGAFVERARTAAAELGLELIALPVGSKKDVPAALQRAFERGEAVWLLRDTVVVSKVLLEQALLLQVEQQKPVLVYAEQFVKSGALAAFTSSYKDQGREAARLARQILDGADPASLPEREARSALWVNVKTATQLHLGLPDGLGSRPDVKLLSP
ncbi:MAG TPA: ABC transporter substrate binding protein [Myxococcota bacterium]|nr:ABC transporter substrate binding protein [Myxococcota bacterium]HRY93528.1 ABC transporter substrate binding protein [Myxococcota bacterium]HSA20549.1 ABC transporter substrate binding protein [Myxococcota bacterium]